MRQQQITPFTLETTVVAAVETARCLNAPLQNQRWQPSLASHQRIWPIVCWNAQPNKIYHYWDSNPMLWWTQTDSKSVLVINCIYFVLLFVCNSVLLRSQDTLEKDIFNHTEVFLVKERLNSVYQRDREACWEKSAVLRNVHKVYDCFLKARRHYGQQYITL